MRPDKCFADQSLLAQIEARRGNLERALSLAEMVNSNPRAIMFRVDEAVLRVEAEKAARRIPRRQDRGQV